MQYRTNAIMGVLLAMGASLPSSALAADCRPLGRSMHCYDPPPPEKFTDEQLAERQRENVQRELAILAPLSGGVSTANCDAALDNAARQARADLHREISRTCGRLQDRTE